MSRLRRMINMQVPSEPRTAQDVTYWGGVPHLRENLPKQLWDYMDLSSRATKTLEDLKTIHQLPSLEDLRGSNEGKELPTPRVLAEKGLEGSLDALMPLTIMGKGAKFFDPKLMAESDALVKKGWSKKKATEETGYFRDQVGNPKFQIRDNDATYNLDWYNETLQKWNPDKDSMKRQLANVYQHPELYKNYSFLKNIEVKLTNKVYTQDGVKEMKYGAFQGKLNPETGEFDGGTILINPRGLKEMATKYGKSEGDMLLDILNHETNHVIQAKEGYPGGSNAAWFKEQKKKLPEVKDLFKQNIQQWKQIQDKESYQAKLLAKVLVAQKRHIDFIDSVKNVDNGLLYSNTLGEADAFWSSAMRKNPDVENILPYHYDQTMGKQLIDKKSTGEVLQDFDPRRSAILDPYSEYSSSAMDSK